MSIYLKRGTSRPHLSDVPLDFFKRENKNSQEGKNASLSDTHEEGARPTTVKGKKNTLLFFKKRANDHVIQKGKDQIRRQGYAPERGISKKGRTKFREKGEKKAASADACLEGKIFTIASYDFVKVIRKARRGDVISQSVNASSHVSPEHTLPRRCPREWEQSLLLGQIEGEKTPTENPFENVTKWEVTMCWKKHRKINIAFVERHNRKNGKTVWARKVKKIYLSPKESTFSPLMDKYLRYEDVVKLERHLTRYLTHRNIVVMESFFCVNDEIVSVYPFGGLSLMRWNKREKLFQLQGMDGGPRNCGGRSSDRSAGGMTLDTTRNKEPHDAVHRMAKGERKKTKHTYVYPEYLLAEIMRQLLTVCQYLDEQEVFHGDIKPSNILVKNVRKKNMNKIYFCTRDKKWYLQRRGTILKKKMIIKLIDFEHAQKTYQGKVNVGGTTSLFKPLEDFKIGRINASPKIVWTLGITLFILSTGAHPFSRINNDMHIWYMLQGRGFDICRRFRRYPFMSSSLKDLLARMLQVDFARRATLPELFLHSFVLFGEAARRCGHEEMTG
ncbi:serine/threonine protein kinase, putative [Plasmodium knowlesi strain H]|uniref:Serine/threonine protein kinase, putative n=2 Tax=Plasmodium knowlesi TaxID=5850 RepID=B3L2V9_PLAKH|nr:serine/threonine protein kinase, putative [Plasmodium knowlesi strain H]OTN67376.1 putative Serine/threonine protein kinase [Plasmodium knowlesi]CAA9987562.1 serine/threonine protein kinase, putative [Plasmodium knowlesi strain H]VVS77036.1 serine/threonine protein kinase, putative [Plasmodium knowlesi strain H]|eukprot:XP_002258563.1 serine/threonine protein kinase, putative [Plasmodium knowlesi strain H]